MINKRLLKIYSDTSKYLDKCHILEEKRIMLGMSGFKKEQREYWKIIPRYIVSRCPICSKAVTEQIDTYTLRKWHRATNGTEVFFSGSSIKHCKHFLATHSFINFNCIRPTKDDLYVAGDFISEAPFVFSFLFEVEKKCKAVLHSLPICRIEGGEFVPRYTLYIMTYFAPRFKVRNILRKLHKYKQNANPWFLLPSPHEGIEGVDSWWDLKKFVENGNLYWLEPDNEEGVLINDINTFPYGNIEGRRFPYVKKLP